MNLLILAGAMTSCLLIASCRSNSPESDPPAEPQEQPEARMVRNPEYYNPNGPQVELKVLSVSISSNKVVLEVINRTRHPVNSIKGQLLFRDDSGEPIYDSLVKSDHIPFNHRMEDTALDPRSKNKVEIDVFVPTSTKSVEALLGQASYSDGTVMQFKPSNQ